MGHPPSMSGGRREPARHPGGCRTNHPSSEGSVRRCREGDRTRPPGGGFTVAGQRRDHTGLRDRCTTRTSPSACDRSGWQGRPPSSAAAAALGTVTGRAPGPPDVGGIPRPRRRGQAADRLAAGVAGAGGRVDRRRRRARAAALGTQRHGGQGLRPPVARGPPVRAGRRANSSTATGSASSPPSTSVGPAGPRPAVRRSWPRWAWVGPRGRPRPHRSTRPRGLRARAEQGR